MTPAAVEVVLYHLSDDEGRVIAAYHEASRRMRGTPGLVDNRLLTSKADPRSYVVVSRWTDWESFIAWEGGATHKGQTAPLRPFRDGERDRSFEIFTELARYDEERREPDAKGN
ncbi:antibiotic biosynthesis monooxygenase family protein [Actinomadura sp. 3N508]|uniref:antibiotic biosynthesis monooxygenase family protein n=1 Tax=Actinomadura sp. 3N508 TaxID=3375153 RepID=UPI003790995E